MVSTSCLLTSKRPPPSALHKPVPTGNRNRLLPSPSGASAPRPCGPPAHPPDILHAIRRAVVEPRHISGARASPILPKSRQFDSARHPRETTLRTPPVHTTCGRDAQPPIVRFRTTFGPLLSTRATKCWRVRMDRERPGRRPAHAGRPVRNPVAVPVSARPGIRPAGRLFRPLADAVITAIAGIRRSKAE